jgi:5'-nucleotidase
MSGSDVVEALENGVSQYPKLEGRFPCVSGVSFEFVPNQPPGARVVASSVMVDGKPIVADRLYRVATKEYLAMGKDG